jgi:hypothetical protein
MYFHVLAMGLWQPVSQKECLILNGHTAYACYSHSNSYALLNTEQRKQSTIFFVNLILHKNTIKYE